MTGRAAGIARMMAFAGRQPTGTLCESLILLDGKDHLDEPERLTRRVLIDVLCERHPEADAAFTAWAESGDPGGAVAVIVAAARTAAG